MSTQSNGTGFIAGLFAFAFVICLAAGITAYAMGWMSIESQPGSTTIEVQTGEIEEAAEETSRQGRELLNETGEALQESGRELEQAADEDAVDVDSDAYDDPVTNAP